jgi:MipA family protein
MNHLTLVCMTLGIALLVSAQPAVAADPIVDDPAQRALEDLEQPPDAGRWTIGLAAGYVPRYEGSKDNVFRILPILSYHNGRFSASTAGVRYNLSSTEGLAFGPRLTFQAGRHEDDADYLQGLGDIPFGIGAGAFFRWRVAGWTLQADATQDIRSGRGLRVDLGVGRSVRFGASDGFVANIALELSDETRARTFYGVDATQSVGSGLPVYTAEGGITHYVLHAAWIHSFTPSWFLLVSAYGKQLSGDAADSPITEQETMFGTLASFIYRF